MKSNLKESLFHFSLFLTILILPLYITAAEKPAPEKLNLVAEPVVKQKVKDVLTPRAKQMLLERDGENAKVWLFFTDKGVFNQSDFQTKAANIELSDKVLKRRAKMNLARVTFADLPVNREYLDEITRQGGKLRRTSKWLNAASYEIPFEKLETIGQLPFVAEIKPLIMYKGEPVEAEGKVLPDQSKSSQPKKLSDDPLNYGSSYNQLNQIGVPSAHASGYDGEGVTLAIFDTGYRKTHEAFAQHYADGRVLAEWDFINDDDNTANESEDGDISSQWNHGTYIWSVVGGYKDGSIYGPAYKANFLLAKTEDMRSETPVEEDNWVAALEWADSLGADVVTTSLGYMLFDAGYGGYLYEDMDGATATTSIAASTAAGLGIVLCNSMGNSGPSSGSLSAPADAFDILACGNVSIYGELSTSSSRGPTFDGRTKPEVCACGVSTFCAYTSDDVSYGTASGTSLSTPLVAGAACLMVQARPDLSPLEIRQTIMETADRADNPDNNYGWGVVNVAGAIGAGIAFEADQTIGETPLTVQFDGFSMIDPISVWIWSFGDDDSAFVEDPSHTYLSAGVYNVSLAIVSNDDTTALMKYNYIVAMGDTLLFEADSAYAGHQAVISVNLANYQEVEQLKLVFGFEESPHIGLDSVTRGERTDYFELLTSASSKSSENRYRYILQAEYSVNGYTAPPLAVGNGEIARLYCTIDSLALGGLNNIIDTTTINDYSLEVTSQFLTYVPRVVPGSIGTRYVLRGDANTSGSYNISDVTYLVAYMFGSGPKPMTVQSGDANNDLKTNISDITYMVAYLFGGGPPPSP